MAIFPEIKQRDVMDCGPTCLAIIAESFGKHLSIARLREQCGKGKQGVSLLAITKTAEAEGFRTLPCQLQLDDFLEQSTFPCIVHWEGCHFLVVWKITSRHVYISDPALGKYKLTIKDFAEHWLQADNLGIALYLTPTDVFYSSGGDPKQTSTLHKLRQYLPKDKRLLSQLGLSVLLGTILSLLIPMLTQLLVDSGIGNLNLNLIYLIVFAQFSIFIGRTCADFLRTWILVHIGSRIGISISGNFLSKLVTLPVSYFNSRNIGDTLQRIGDSKKIEDLLTSQAVGVVFSIANIMVFSALIFLYSPQIFFIFLTGTLLSVYWLTFFLPKLRVLDHEQFGLLSSSKNTVVDMVNGMAELRINQGISRKKWNWESIQAKLYRLRLRTLAFETSQSAGTMFFNESKNIIITLVAASLVVNGELTLGMLLAITFILGQMNGPIEQLLMFVRSAQDAQISFERLTEFDELKSEDADVKHSSSMPITNQPITLKDVSFRYNIHSLTNVLEKINLTIPHNQTTAIVGTSGSGKTTLLKLLLKIHEVEKGQLLIGKQDIRYINAESWREKCGVVFQDGYIYSDSILFNIAMSDAKIDIERAVHSAKIANIHDEIEAFPQGYYTPIGNEGSGLSGGQKQRILIARAIYKQPEYLFFDEATSALDTNNERLIQENLQYVFKNKTVVVIAHRLSTVQNADQIIVLDNGRVVESGKHQQLCEAQGKYYQLIKNQLALGN